MKIYNKLLEFANIASDSGFILLKLQIFSISKHAILLSL